MKRYANNFWLHENMNTESRVERVENWGGLNVSKAKYLVMWWDMGQLRAQCFKSCFNALKLYKEFKYSKLYTCLKDNIILSHVERYNNKLVIVENNDANYRKIEEIN